eukprot:1733686-Rhodomonas_salina.2
MAFVDDLTLHQRVEHWLAVEESFQNDAKFLPSGSTFTLQLENLVAEPEKHLEALVKWLGFQHGMNGFDKTLLKEWLNSLQADPNKKYEEVGSMCTVLRMRYAVAGTELGAVLLPGVSHCSER